ncbi:bifunctional pyr operon transcriptional regulator/uracil phosphoribosyltransferase PyrR [Yaniella flava]|uniref:bifunctional pyr operon transcriptional regulator/uracil phosphoribosyltransferase PyrR n=1 Tax=Yaniella flava TaxID=287930 RepID=UPI0031CEDADE
MQEPVRQARTVMSADDIDRVLTRIAHEILEANRGAQHLLVLGIPRRGVPLANRLAAKLAEIEPDFVAAERTGQLDITMYRDDLARAGSRVPASTIIPATGVDGAVVVLVDDVLYSGRTIRAALDALADIGRPETVRLAVLVDRGHRQLPLRADYVGKNLPTASTEHVRVQMSEIDSDDEQFTVDQVQILDVMN